MPTLKIPIEFDLARVRVQLKQLVRTFEQDGFVPTPAKTQPPTFTGSKYLPGQIVKMRGEVPAVVTAVRPPTFDGMRLYDVVTLDGSRHLYTDEAECTLKPDVPLTSSSDTE